MAARRLRIAAAILAVSLGCASLGDLAYDAIRDPGGRFRDFVFDQASAKALLDGGDAYVDPKVIIPRIPEYRRYGDALRDTSFPQWHPPLRILLQLPLARLPFLAAYLTWLFLSAIAVVSALYLVARDMRWDTTTTITVSFGALITPLVREELGIGNAEAFVLLGLVLAWRAVRRYRDPAAGAWLGALAALRLYPAFLVLPFVEKRRGVVWVAGTVMAAGFVIPWLLIGSPWDFFKQFSGYWPWRSGAGSWNISLHRYLGSLFALPASGLLALVSLRPPRQASGDRFWSAVPLMLLAAPVAWSLYLVLALPWLALTLSRTAGTRRITFMVIAAVCVSHLPGLPIGSHEIRLAITMSAVILGALLEAVPLPVSRLSERSNPTSAQ